jgi:hypothetical protein
MKRIFSVFLIFSFVSSSLYARIGDVTKVCTEPVKTEFFPVGDSTGKSVLTKLQEIRECNVTKTVQGKCIRWEENNESTSLPEDKYNVFDTKDYSGGLGTLLGALGAYDQIHHLWSGWHGYCEIGTASDFSWAQDPMFWGSLMLSAVMTASTPGSSDAATTTAAKQTSQNAVTDAVQETGKTVGGWVDKVSGNVISENAQSAAHVAYDNAASQYGVAYARQYGQQIMEQAMEQYYTKLGMCLMAGAYNFAVSTYEFYNEFSKSKKTLPCDPVDETCNGDNPEETQFEQPYTVDETQFNDLVETFQEKGENIYDYIEVISIDNGVVTYKFKKFNEMANVSSMNDDEIKDLQKKLAEMKYAINLVSNSIQVASCFFGNSASVSLPTDTVDRRTSTIRSTVSAAADFAAKFLPQPYGAIAAAAVKILTYTLTSFDDIDACHNEKDAKTRDKRQLRTMKSLKYNLCHFVKKECVETNFLDELFGKDCSLYGYYYCCYDQLLTKILVEQMKAELGRDWTHCTGITLRDLQFISFRQCSDSEMSDGIDGAHQIGDYNPEDAFQYKHKCMDLTEFMNYLNKTLDLDMSPEDFKDYWNNIVDDQNNIN